MVLKQVKMFDCLTLSVHTYIKKSLYVCICMYMYMYMYLSVFIVYIYILTKNHRIIECFGLEGTFRGHLAQPPCSEQ